MPWGYLAWLFIKDVVTGEIRRLWQWHKAEVKSQAIADAPATEGELLEELHEGKL